MVGHVQVIRRVELAGVDTRVVGPDDARRTIVLMHGFGAPGDDLVPLADEFGGPARFVFPEAPLELGGLYGDARAWWHLDLAALEAQLRTGTPRDRRAEIPDGLVVARELGSRLVDEVKARFGIDDRALVLGGFSQGAMLALDVALHRDTPPGALVLLSGTLIAEPAWQPRMTRLAGVPVFQSHGRQDPLLPFSIAELLRDRLLAAGTAVDWQAFAGGHEIPYGVLTALRAFLARLG